MATVDYNGEFGYELLAVVPYAYFLYTRGELKKTISSKDTECFYAFSPNHHALYPRRTYKPLIGFPITSLEVHDFDYSKWVPPPYKTQFKSDRFQWPKPLLVVCNKCEIQWAAGVFNCIDLNTLQILLDRLQPHYTIVYSNPPKTKIVDDECVVVPFKDKELIRERYPDVLLIEDLYEKHKDLSFNTFQCMLYASCENFISVQGGSSVLASYFGGRNYILAVEGGETIHDSYSGYFRRLSGCNTVGFRTLEDFREAVLHDFT
jgi:hypothetical protein